jgi:hypothetical protein
MFENSERSPSKCTQYTHDQANVDQLIPQFADGGNSKILLPRGSGQPSFAPQPYYYCASQSGVVPSWVVDEWEGRNRRRR